MVISPKSDQGSTTMIARTTGADRPAARPTLGVGGADVVSWRRGYDRAMELRGEFVRLRTLRSEHAPALRAIIDQPEVAAWWGKMPVGFPLEDDPVSKRLTIVVDGKVAGLIQFGEETDPDYRHAWIDIFLDPAFHGQGVGIDSFKALIHYLFEQRGHHRLTTDPAPHNRAAIRLCERLGFRGVGVMRSYWRDTSSGSWRDAFLMELVKQSAPKT